VGLTESVALQLAVGVFFATTLFFLAYSLPRTVSAIFLLLLIPFQPVETKYFTANVLITYGIFIALMLRRDAFHMPMLPQVLILLFCYFLAFSQVHPATYVQHAVYLFALISAILVFWITYDLTMRFEDAGSIVKLFLVTNIFVVIYCAIQISQGPGTKLVLFGNENFSMMTMRTNYRLS